MATKDAAADSTFITLEQSDMNDYILKGALEKKYKKGEDIVVENAPSQQRIFQIHSGTCSVVVKSKTDGSEKIVASMGPGALFGELSFLEEGDNAKATASVRASSDDDVKVLILEGL